MLNDFEAKKLVLKQNLTQQSAEMISFERDRTVMDIQNLAIATKITTGKVRSLIPMPHTPTILRTQRRAYLQSLANNQ